MNRKTLLVCLIFILSCFLVTGCGRAQVPTVEAYQPEATPVPTPSPTPYMEPLLEEGPTVYVKGTEVRCVTENGFNYIPLETSLKALTVRLVTYPEQSFTGIPEQFAFSRGETEYVFYPGETYYSVTGEEGIQHNFDGATIAYNGQKSLYVPVEVFCELNGLLLVHDDANTAVYCVEPVDWKVAEGYKVPVIQFYGVGMANTYELLATDYLMREIDFPDILDSIYEAGYEPIWFSDLEHIEEYENPVLITFCYNGNHLYNTAFPIIKSYQTKVTVFVYPDQYGTTGYVTAKQLTEMYGSGYVDLQSGGVTVDPTGTVSNRRLTINMDEAYLTVLRLTGKLPIAFAYAEGISDPDNVSLVPQYFKFGVVYNDNECFVTGINMTEIPAARFIRTNGAYSVIAKLDAFTGNESGIENQPVYYYE